MKRRDSQRVYRDCPSLYAPSACHPHLNTAKTPPPACNIVDDWGFFYATPSYCIYTGRPSHLSLATAHQLLSVRRSTPRDARTERQKQYPLRVIRWSDSAYITHHCAAAALIPERLRWNIARAGNCLPLACALRCAAFPACRSLRHRLLVVIPSAIGH